MATGKPGRSNLMVISGLIMGLALVAVVIAYGWGLKQIELVQKEDTCIQRASLIAGALGRYAREHKGVLPSRWEDLIRGDYLLAEGDVYRCPLDRTQYDQPPSYRNTSYEVRWGADLGQLDESVPPRWLTAYDESQFSQLLIYHRRPRWLTHGHGHPRAFREVSVNLYRWVTEYLASSASK